MPLKPRAPITYLITSGRTDERTVPADKSCLALLDLIKAAVDARIDMIQIREKRMTARTLYELACRAVEITAHTQTALLINDRADIAKSVGADGVHLTTESMQPEIIRRIFGQEFLIGSSTHNLVEALAAKDGGADFIVFGPVFETPSKKNFEAAGLTVLEKVARAVDPLPVLAIGGIDAERIESVLRAGAKGFAGIRIFEEAEKLPEVIKLVRSLAKDLE